MCVNNLFKNVSHGSPMAVLYFINKEQVGDITSITVISLQDVSMVGSFASSNRMWKVSFALVLCYLLITTATMVHGSFGDSNEMNQWIQNLGHAKEKVTKLHFYFQDILRGTNPTSVTVVQCPIKNSPTKFGTVNIIDDPLTIGPEPTSKQVGRAQGLYAITALNWENFAVLMSMNLVFTSGSFNGSSLAILGWNPPLHPSRELAIVGGTGVSGWHAVLQL